MEKLTKSVKFNMSLFGVLSVLFGLVLIIYPGTAVKFICMAIGGILLIAGIYSVIIYFRNKSNMGENSFFTVSTLILGIIEGGVGTSILIRPEYFTSFLSMIFAIILFVHGINDISKGIRIKKFKYGNWFLPIIFGLIGIIFSAVVIWNPFATMNALMILIGVALVIDGVTEIITGFMYSISMKESEVDKDGNKIIDVDYEEVHDSKEKSPHSKKTHKEEKKTEDRSSKDKAAKGKTIKDDLGKDKEDNLKGKNSKE